MFRLFVYDTIIVKLFVFFHGSTVKSEKNSMKKMILKEVYSLKSPKFWGFNKLEPSLRDEGINHSYISRIVFRV